MKRTVIILSAAFLALTLLGAGAAGGSWLSGDKQGSETALDTQPFTFGTHENIEFASGMVEHNSDFIITVGIRDCKFAIVRIDRNKLIDLLEAIK